MTGTQEAALPVTTKPPPGRATLISIMAHGAVIALLIFALPYFPKHAVPEAMAPIAISIVPDTQAQDETPQAEPTQSAPQAEAAAPEADATPEAEQPTTLPPDPSYNPFTTSLEVTENTSPQTLQTAPAQQAPANSGGQTQDQSASVGNGFGNNGAGPSGGVPSRNAQPGRFDGDPLLHPQYLSIHLSGFVPIMFTEQLHDFLIRLIQCGVVPLPAKDPNLSVEADVEFNPIGGVKSVRLTNQGEFTEAAYQKAATALMGALTNPSCAYIRLPPQYYPSWHQVHLSFFQHVPG